MNRTRLWELLFLIVGVIHLIFVDHSLVVYATKPLLMPILAIILSQSKLDKSTRFFKFLMMALLWSMMGDIALMFVSHPPHYDYLFIVGLGSFLLAHLFYIISFNSHPNPGKGLISKLPILVLPILLYMFGMLTFLWKDLPQDLKIPVFVYSLAIGGMVVSVLNLKGEIPQRFFLMIITGALLFMISDSIIAINKFSLSVTIPFASVWIMAFYILGQYLIVRGSVGSG